MKRIGPRAEEVVTSGGLADRSGDRVSVQGAVHRIRALGGISFVILRDRDGLLQAVVEGQPEELVEGAWVRLSGDVVAEERAPGGVELRVEDVDVVAAPAEQLPLVINKRVLDVSLHEKLNLRPVSLRHESERATFRVQAEVVRLFREYLTAHGFTEVRSPKIVAAATEGGANLFQVDYFGRRAFLAQSPQLYKQFMVGVYERVFEVGPVYRAEKHNTSRHLNEYVSLDFEMGFIHDHEDVMAMEAGLMAYIVPALAERCAADLELLDATLPEVGEIPALPIAEAAEILRERYGHDADPDDLDPRGEELVYEYARDELGSEFVFITDYPEAKRPFYAKDDPDQPGLTRSFDLILRGLEVTTGGQRINDYDEQVTKMRRLGLDPADFEHFLLLHRYGVPPHGGLAIGLERLTMKLLGYANVREATLFPRDIDRLTP